MKYTKEHQRKEEELRQTSYAFSLWKRLEGKELNENQFAFISQCMTENLEHARHVENERLTFNSIFLALVAGALAFADSFQPMIAIGIYFVLALAGFLSIVLTARWNNAFNRHQFYAQQCYRLLHINLFGKGEALAGERTNPEEIEGIDEIPLYSFRIHKPVPYTKLGELLYKPRTRNLYIAFYWIIQALLIASIIFELFKIF